MTKQEIQAQMEILADDYINEHKQTDISGFYDSRDFDSFVAGFEKGAELAIQEERKRALLDYEEETAK